MPCISASVIINNYNYGRYLADAIDSALGQTCSDWEVIVVDDGSSDESRHVIANYGDRVIPVLKKNGGHASAFNAGFRCSRGQVILFLDADDVLLPTAIEKALGPFQDPRVVHVHWPLWKVNAAGQRTGEVVPGEPLPRDDFCEFVQRHGPATYPVSPTSGNAWSRRYLESVLPIPEEPFRQAAESYLFTLSPIYGLLAVIDEPQSHYRIHGHNYTLQPTAIQTRDALERYKHRCELLRDHLLRRHGIAADIAAWREQAWLPRLDAAMRDIATCVPAGERLILVGREEMGLDGDLAGRSVLPFLERDGEPWGLPADDSQAIAELERMRRGGVQFMAFAWPSFWWLDHYRALARQLESFPCVLRNDRVVIFSLSQ
jgi:glycosyltransferase involved in cell wall biosynthesis